MIRFLLMTYFLFCSVNVFSFTEGDSLQGSSIKFGEFEAILAKKIIHFKWSVAQEKKGDYFLLEKSIDKIEWREITQIQSIRNHEEQHTYSISEINFSEGAKEFFRISRVDVFGNVEILDIVEINQPILQNMLLIPIKGKANKQMILSYDSMLSSRGKITIMNEQGDLVLLKTVQLIDGYNRYMLSIKNLKPGVYHVLIRDEFNNTISKSLTIYSKKKKR